jgi:hypothetical protein
LKAHCEQVLGKSFEDSTVSNADFLWVAPQKGQAEATLKTYLAAKVKNPALAACLFLSKKASKAESVRHNLKGMTIIADGKTSSCLSTNSEARAPWPYLVLYDRPRPVISLALAIINPGLKMQLLCHCSGSEARA